MGEPDYARLVFLSILGVALLSGIFAYYRGRLSQGLQHAAIWGLIILGATLLFSFRAPLEHALFPNSAVSTGEQIILRRDGSGHFVTVAEVNDTPVRFIVDTGASSIVLARQDAMRAGIDPATLNFSGRAMTANGTVRLANVVLDTITLADQTDRNVFATVNGGELAISLLGMSYLDRFSQINVAGDVMTLTR
ncbi:aspartyl protease family protein [Rubricella aquisinus]|uniref:Aspartyl protease family protein n=1 Tax=Rubricella aquisinus TaxID=2028108 RepID=A0A840WZ38_9RHOB|nr:TIGR02281 family clan AA aspartic protease [Rubricella aquisinus]MBB5514926.1 aspartyl protease family protein [Rubricella aquisinus]